MNIKKTSINRLHDHSKKILYFFIIILNVNLNVLANDNVVINHGNIADHLVELIVFKYLDETSIGTEIFGKKITSNHENQYKKINDLELIDISIIDQLIQEDISFGEAPENNNTIYLNELPTDKNILFKIAPKESWTLENTYSRLDRIKVYQPIIWNGWYQSLNELDFSQNINIRRLKNTLGVLKGHVKLYTSKGGKLRLALDISMLEENKYWPKSEEIYDLENTDTLPQSFTEIISYPFTDDKEMKLNELRYFDHPKFGVIAKVTKINIPLMNNEMKNAKIDPLKGNVFDQHQTNNSQQYVSLIDRGIVGLAKTGKYISLTINRNGKYEIHVADQLAIDKLKHNEIKNDSFTFTVSNGKESEKRQLNIQITGINNPPISMDKTIIHDNLTPYSFSINDFYFDDAESDILKYLILTELPSDGKIYLEYPFGIWDVSNNMQINYEEISHLRYQGPILERSKNTSLVKYRVSDGQVISDTEYSIIFQKPTLIELKSEDIPNNLLSKDNIEEVLTN